MERKGHQDLILDGTTDRYYALVAEYEDGTRTVVRITEEQKEAIMSQQPGHRRAIFVGGPLDGQIIDVGQEPRWVYEVGDGSKQVYLRNVLRAKGNMLIAFTMGLMDATSILHATMRNPAAADLWQPNDEEA